MTDALPPTRTMREARRAETRNRAARMDMTISRAERVRNARIDAEVDALARSTAREAVARDRRHREADELGALQTAYDLYGRDGLRAGFEAVGGRVVREPPLRLTRDQVQRIGREAAAHAPRPATPASDDSAWFNRAWRAAYKAKYGRNAPRSTIRTYSGHITVS